MNRIEKRFHDLRAAGARAFIPYIMAGDPSLRETERLIHILDSSGADVIELGVPFSDPLADGPVIQRAAERALKKGVTLEKILGLVKKVRKSSEVPIVLMTYYNPIYKYGEARFIEDAVKAGVDGAIIPDLPPDEAGSYIRESRRRGFSTIFLIAPTSTPERISRVAKASTGFIYYVSITGITGSAIRIDDLKAPIAALKKVTNKPVAVGFGVSTPKEARAVSSMADGVIVGSAIIKNMGPGLEKFVRGLRKAI